IGQNTTRLDHGATSPRVDLDLLHERQIDHETVVADGVAGDVVPAAAHCDEQLLLASELHGLADIASGFAASDQRRFAIDHPVPDLARLVVAWISGKKDVSSEM